jgi:Toluene-4-monooxygenase system protein B (TmoB)
MLVPLYGFVAGDTLGVLVLVQDHDTIAQVAGTLARAVAMRVAPRAGARVRVRGELLDPRATVAGAGLRALDRIDLVPVGDEP